MAAAGAAQVAAGILVAMVGVNIPGAAGALFPVLGGGIIAVGAIAMVSVLIIGAGTALPSMLAGGIVCPGAVAAVACRMILFAPRALVAVQAAGIVYPRVKGMVLPNVIVALGTACQMLRGVTIGRKHRQGMGHVPVSVAGGAVVLVVCPIQRGDAAYAVAGVLRGCAGGAGAPVVGSAQVAIPAPAMAAGFHPSAGGYGAGTLVLGGACGAIAAPGVGLIAFLAALGAGAHMDAGGAIGIAAIGVGLVPAAAAGRAVVLMIPFLSRFRQRSGRSNGVGRCLNLGATIRSTRSPML